MNITWWGRENLAICRKNTEHDYDKKRDAHMCQLKKQFIFKLKNQRQNLN